ncbi:UPF0481 protein At3g47200 [Linum perenne]
MDGGPSAIQSTDTDWLESIKIELSELSPLSSSWTICRVPTKLRNTNNDAYTPHIVSVGPIHHKEKSLKGMEAHKWRYMLSLLERTQNAVSTLDACGKAILRFDSDVRSSYASPRIEARGKGNSNIEFIHCAAALKEAGIEFEKDETRSLFDLEFKNGVFRIPPLRVHDSTDSLFRNFIAFEQCFQESSQYITSYVLLMDRLIDTAKDVEVLERRRIIANDLGGREDVAAMFNNICKQIVLRDFYFAGVCEQVNEYYHRRWNRYKASLKRDYCTNPWTIISLFAGFVLITLTAVQTVYSVLAYYDH